MRRLARMSALGACAIAGLAAVPTAFAAPASTTFQVFGAEVGFTPTQGTFVGKAFGNSGDRGAWRAVVDHAPLSSLPAAITGGSFNMATTSPTWRPDFVAGTFTGGTIDVINPGPLCTNQTFAVSGDLGNVATTTTSGGSGVFKVILTHYRTVLFGRCLTYSATVAGTATFAY
jgi:hypothetical protein